MKPTDQVTSTAELKARLSHYLGLVRRGGRVVVTHRGQPIAALEPIDAESTDQRTARLVASGQARAAGAPLPAGFWEEAGPADPDGRALSGLLTERTEGR